MQMADNPDRFISPARSIAGPGTSAAVSGTSMGLGVSMVMPAATLPATRGSSGSLCAFSHDRASVHAAPALPAARNARREGSWTIEFDISDHLGTDRVGDT